MKPKNNLKVSLIAGALTVIMFAFSFALPPLYNVLCKKTGLNSAVRIALADKEQDANEVLDKRQILIQFLTFNNEKLAWDFFPFTNHIMVHPGEIVKVQFYAKNLSKKTMTVQAIPAFTPTNTALFFHKIQCFCYSQQTLKSGETINMPVLFQIDKNLPQDIQTITVSYTLFDVTGKG